MLADTPAATVPLDDALQRCLQAVVIGHGLGLQPQEEAARVETRELL